MVLVGAASQKDAGIHAHTAIGVPQNLVSRLRDLDAQHSSGEPKGKRLWIARALGVRDCAAVQGQRIERVTVYPSDFGMEQMAAEARLGPQSVFGSKARPAANGSGGSARPDGGTEPDEDGSDDGDDDAGQGTADR